MSKLLSPLQVARAIQVSESSIKRWCDKGELEVTYTAGGHRKISTASLIRFLKSTGQPLVHPEMIGLPKLSGERINNLDYAAGELAEALIHGQELRSRQLIVELYLSENSLASIFDRVLTPAMRELGDKWQCGELQIFQERRGCEIVLQAIQELRLLVRLPEPQAPVAIGGAVAGDYYRLPTAMVELLLRELGWNAASLGDNLPLQTLERAIEQYRPRLFWLSCSHLNDPDEFLRQYQYLYDLYEMSVAFVVGGRAITESLRSDMKFSAYCGNMQHLESYLQSLEVISRNPLESKD